MNTFELAKYAVRLLDAKKAVDIQVLKTMDLTSLADYFIIAAGNSFTQVSALAEDLDFQLGQAGHQPRRIERDKGSNWILLDYGDIIIHVFYKETRAFYALERLWADAQKFDAETFLVSEEQ